MNAVTGSTARTARSLCRGALLALLALAVVAAPAARAAERAHLVVFGDSLSDAGNHFALFGEWARPPYELVPAAPYPQGRARFSNGPTWVELLAERLGAPRDAAPALRDAHRAANYAIGTARARVGGPDDSIALDAQVAQYLEDREQRASSRALHVVWIGGNDARDALVALGPDGQNALGAQVILADALASVVQNIEELHDHGARRFLILNLTDLGVAPAVRAIPGLPPVATALSAGYNAQLAAAIDALRELLPEAEFAEFDVFSLLQSVVAAPQRYGLEDAQTPCLRFGVARRTVCSDPDERLYWDGIHPTRAGHAVLASRVYRRLRGAR